MKKILFLAAIVAAMLTSCGNGQSAKELQSERDSLQKALDERDGELNEMLEQFNEIQESFSQINQAAGRVNLIKKNGEAKKSEAELRENLNFIQETLASNKQKISELEQKLNSSNAYTAKLKETIQSLIKQLEAKNEELENLRAQLADKDVEIAVLNADVSILTSENATVKQQRDESQELARQQDASLNKAWYVFGTGSELKKHGIISGGNMFRKSSVQNGDFNKSYFTEIDIRQVTTIPFSSKSADLLTNHPSDSYTLMKDASNGEVTLRIIDVKKFWSVSKYLVVRTK